jgi:hypothetical protein
MNYLFPYGNLTPTSYTQPIVGHNNNNAGNPPENVLNGKERDNTWLQLPVCPNLIKNKEEYQECALDAKCRTIYGMFFIIFILSQWPFQIYKQVLRELIGRVLVSCWYRNKLRYQSLLVQF